MIKIQDDDIEINGDSEEVVKEFTLIAMHICKIFEEKYGRFFDPMEIMATGMVLLKKEDGDND